MSSQAAQLNNVFGTNRLGPVMNPNGTVVTPNESFADWSQGVEHAAAENAAGAGGFLKNFLEPAGSVLGTTLALGAVAAAPELSPLLGGGIGGAVGAGAIAGAAGSGLSQMIAGKNLSAGGILTGAALGGVGGGLTYGLGANGLNVTGSLTNSGIPAPLASGLVRGGTSALTGGITSALSGNGFGTGAIVGGVGGAASGLASGAASSLGAGGAVAGGIGSLTGKLASGAVGGLMQPTSGALPMMPNPGLAYNVNGGSPSSSGISSSSGTSSALPYLGIGALGAGAALSDGQGNMASTDTSLASTITGALPGLLQAGATTGAGFAASNAQVGALNNAITTQQNTLGNIGNIWSNQQSLGQGADTSLGSALGTNGQPANYSNFYNMPGYQFAVNQGTQAIQRQAAAMGSAYTPNTAAAVGQYVTNTASQDYNTYISQLMGAAGLGSTANTQLQGANINAGNNISTLQQNIGQAQAGAYNTAGSSVAGLFGSSGAGTGLLNGLLGGGSGGGSTAGGATFDSSGVPQLSDQDISNIPTGLPSIGDTSFDSSGVPQLSSTDLTGLGSNVFTDNSGDDLSYLGDF